MTTSLRAAVIRPPPPSYSVAIDYPSEAKNSTIKTTCVKVEQTACDVSLDKNISNEHVYQILPEQEETAANKNVYPKLPGDIVYLYHPGHLYSNISVESYRKRKYIYRVKNATEGKALIVLEPIPETLASSQESMGVKTYAQLEVVEPGSQQGPSMCGVGGVNGCEGVGGMNRCGGEIQTNGKAVLVPVNGLISNDRMIVDSLLSDSSCENWNHEDRDEDDRHSHTSVGNGDIEISPVNNQVDLDLESLTKALDNDENSVQSGETTPLLQSTSAQCKHNEVKKELPDIKVQRRCDNEQEYADSGYSDSNRLEFKEHVTDHSAEHVLDTVIYSEPEYSSSDMSIKCTGDSLHHALDRCQRTLKRTNNGTDHTVYELSPSDSFYSSADNMQNAGKRSLASGDGICRIDHSSSSLTDGKRSRQALHRDTSVTFKKPIVVDTKDANPTSRVDMQHVEPQLELTDTESLAKPNLKLTASSETIPSQIILDNTRTYYRRKAPDRGTLYCAAGGITVVATIIFLLIYCS